MWDGCPHPSRNFYPLPTPQKKQGRTGAGSKGERASPKLTIS
ncbi:hypothetical protein NSP_15320 [Nodularia spumigena CCY9414]|nr:hypothetical protein NSP_15320 [Nodularia spumigena CCY9414]